VKTIVAAFQNDMPHELQQGLLQRKDLRLIQVRSLADLLDRVNRGVDLCLVGPQLEAQPALAIGHAVRSARRSANVPLILVLQSGTSAPPNATPIFSEVVDWPRQSAVLYEALSRHLGWAAREHERYPLRLHVFLYGSDSYIGSTIDLSQDGMLLRTSRPLPIGERLHLRFALPGNRAELSMQSRILRSDHQTYAPDHACALRFESPTDDARQALRELFTTLSGGRSFRYRIDHSGNRQAIHLAGVLTAEVDLTPLSQLRGELDFYLQNFRRISSDSIQTWIEFIRTLTGASKIRLHDCPIQFIQQANAISNLLDHTEVVSFFAPYLCPKCGLDEERLIDVQADLHDASGLLHRRPPAVKCIRCAVDLTFDDIPERYFMFL
jgi:hypothetical protein